MAVYAIGDIQGCGTEFEGLLARLDFDPRMDQLWVAGDLVNRGPRSLHVLRRIRNLGDAARVVLGNHDIHLLGLAHGRITARPSDTVGELLDAPDGRELVAWLRRQPLVYRDQAAGWTMVHAALHPRWDPEEAGRRAEAVEATLRGPWGPELAGALARKDLPTLEPDPADEWEWLRFTAAVLTRTRFCTADGEFAWGGTAPAEPRFRAWYAHEGRASRGHPIVYGHWAADGLTQTADTLGLDSGCVWGGALSAARLDSQPVAIWQWDCPGYLTPDR
jgi:bis(5'-nucleosyl)-tetraphosphatase (symmetrical)